MPHLHTVVKYSHKFTIPRLQSLPRKPLRRITSRKLLSFLCLVKNMKFEGYNVIPPTPSILYASSVRILWNWYTLRNIWRPFFRLWRDQLWRDYRGRPSLFRCKAGVEGYSQYICYPNVNWVWGRKQRRKPISFGIFVKISLPSRT